MALVLREADVNQVATMGMALAAVEAAFRELGQASGTNLPRERIRLANGRILHTLVAAAPASRAIGLKTYTSSASGTRFLVVMFDTETGELLALLEADRLGQLRTGASTGLATRLLAREDAAVVGQIGAGWQSRTQIAAICAVRSIRQVRVFSRDAERRMAYCQEMSAELGVEMVPAESAEVACRDADILLAITTARDPVILGQWVQSGQHLVGAGSNWAVKQEIDAEAIGRASLVAIDEVENGKIECGDLVAAVEAGTISWDRVVPLGDIVTGKRPGRQRPDDITVFESQGLGILDMTMAARVYAAAKAAGLGTEVQLFEGGRKR
ncbi:MAG: ornithine cyclodeaminase family protein [Chloroflexi bacterium]|nr:ornithine cyclodeaminase family protein [Chloroflexota bacterium]